MTREAQNRGYNDGKRGWIAVPTKFGYKGHLADAYMRGHAIGKQDQQQQMKKDIDRACRTCG